MECIKIIEQRFVPIFKKWMLTINDYSNDNYIKIYDHEVVESKIGTDQYSDYINSNSTKDAKITIRYKVFRKSDDKLLNSDTDDGFLSAEYFIPVTIHNLFIIDGKVRAPLNYLQNVTECCRYGKDILVLTPEVTLNFNTDTIQYVEDDYYSRSSLPFDDFSKLPNDYLNLTDEVGKRLYVQYDLTTIPKRLTRELLEQLRTPIPNHRDHITKKKVISVFDALLIHLTSRENAKSILRTTRTRFYRLGKYYSTSVNTCIKQFFKGQSEYLVGMQTESNFNPTTYETLANKVILEKYDQGQSGPISQTDYNESLALLVDPTMTPDSMNINRINELNYSTKFDGFDTYIEVINIATHKTESLSLLDYLCEKILTSEHWDYDNMKFKKYDTSTKINYRHKGNYHKMDASEVTSTTFKYVDTRPDNRLARSTRSVPNINYSDSVRISMGARMNNQSITIMSAEPPMVSTGHKDYDKMSLIINSNVNGRVVEIGNSVVIESVENGKTKRHSFPIPDNMAAQYRINVSFEPTVKVGDKVKAGDVLIKPLGITKSGQPLLGTNAFTVFGHYYGFTYEDGTVVSESFAEKLTHVYVMDFEAKVKDIDKIEGITPLGTQLVSRDAIMKIQRRKSASKQVRELTDIFFPEENQELDFDVSIWCPNNVFESWLVDAKYCLGGQENEYAVRQVEQYMKDKPKSKIQLPFKYHYNMLDDLSNEPEEPYAVKVMFRLVVRAKAMIGDKVTNRYGSKGVITKIIPDDQMWKTSTGQVVDIIMNPMAVLSRKNLPQTMEVGLTQVSTAVYNSVMKKLDDITAVRKELEAAEFTDYLKLSDKELVAKLERDKKLIYTVGCYGRLTPGKISQLLDKYGLDDGRMTIIKADGKPLKQKVVCGYQYIEKLLFLSAQSNKVTSDDFESEAMVLGLGADKTGGQSLEEMIFWSLNAHGATDAINRFRESSGRKSEYWLRAHILTAGLDLTEKKD